VTVLFAVGNRIPSSPIFGPLVAVILYLISQRLIKGVAAKENDFRMIKLLRWSLILHLACAPAQIFVVDHFYHGVADYTQYDLSGSIIANNFRHFDFSIAGSNAGAHILGDGATSIAAGVVMTFVGTDQLAAFFVFAWFSFLGSIAFFRAFSVTFPDANKRRYALMLFFLPSILFWTAAVGKEGIISLSLGLIAYGCARVLARLRGGYLLILFGGLIGVYIRPNELALAAGGFAIAMVFRPMASSGGKAMKGIRLIGSWIFLAVVLSFVATVAAKLVHVGGSTGLTGALNKIGNAGKGNTTIGSVSGTAAVPYSKNPLTYPRDVYEVLFNPLPFTARSATQLIAAAENTVIAVLIYKSLRNLRCVIRACRYKPYVLMCLIYTLAFFYAFAALGNEGVIIRERTLLFPFLLVLLNVPVVPKGHPPFYPWEKKRPKRAERKRAKRAQQTNPFAY